jgi:hypothetical protein
MREGGRRKITRYNPILAKLRMNLLSDVEEQFLQLYIGCSGWSYTSWQGPFYPSNLENKQWLSYYSQIFNYVEIDHIL